MTDFTLEEQVICSIARLFGPEDDLAVTATNASGLMALLLAKELYAPRLSVLSRAKGRWAFVRDIRFPFMPGNLPEECIETLVDMEEVFSFVVAGKYFIIMQPVQVDKYGYMNLSLVGDMHKPSMAFIGSRGVPDNTVNMPHTLYFLTQHLKRVFVEKVDFISGVGYGEERKQGLVKWGSPIRIMTNLCLIDFDEETGLARLKSIHSGVTLDQVRENTGFDLIIPETLTETEAPSEKELHFLREVMDPLGVRRLDFVRGDEYKKVMAEIMKGGR
ncbi:MAG: CoA-transferase [Pseudomonadota bacterium]